MQDSTVTPTIADASRPTFTKRSVRRKHFLRASAAAVLSIGALGALGACSSEASSEVASSTSAASNLSSASASADRPQAALTTHFPYQIGYVTTDADQAVKNLGAEVGATEWLYGEEQVITPVHEGETLPIKVKIHNATIGGVEFEVIQPISDPTGLYTDFLPDSGFGMALHHIAYRVSGDEANWGPVRAKFDDSQVTEGVVGTADQPAGHFRYMYVDKRAELGHYLEYLWLSPETYASMPDNLPQN